ncbi:hypothetical protein [Vagococcus sp. WN89Y]|uniref:hypothetical protein n=1 Tax=Vagococcus sp. WN89Y TaxID=3457258 RepID=UPI003FCD5879
MCFKRMWFTVLIAIGTLFAGSAVAQSGSLTTDQVKQKIIEESIASYPGVCACPYNRARNGSSCGRRSAWSKAGGYSPICYKDEVTAEMVAQWRRQNSG